MCLLSDCKYLPHTFLILGTFCLYQFPFNSAFHYIFPFCEKELFPDTIGGLLYMEQIQPTAAQGFLKKVRYFLFKEMDTDISIYLRCQIRHSDVIGLSSTFHQVPENKMGLSILKYIEREPWYLEQSLSDQTFRVQPFY